MKVLRDHQGLAIRLTDERLLHILEHPEMIGMEAAIEETLSRPQQVVESFSDPGQGCTIDSILARAWATSLSASS